MDEKDISRSATAVRLGINNTPSPQIIENAKLVMSKILAPIEAYYKKPVKINCMYRCPKLNKAIGGAATSQHLLGKAVDFTVQGITVKQVFNDIISGRIKGLKDVLDQCIEEGTWLHISYDIKQHRKQFLVMRNGKYTPTTKEI